MKLDSLLMLSVLGQIVAAREKRTDPSGCHADNCLRAIRATSILPQASLDCSNFLVATTTRPPVTVTVTSSMSGIARRTYASYGPIPPYATACTDTTEYSSACSCLGIHPSTITLAASSTTSTIIVSALPACTGETCEKGFVSDCDVNNNACYCFTNAEEDGFCGQNMPCNSLTICETDNDCVSNLSSSGDTCAFSTCCSESDEAGYCLPGSCGNPSSKLAEMSKTTREVSKEDTAAFRRQ